MGVTADTNFSLEVSVLNADNMVFVAEAKASATKLAQLIETAKRVGIEKEEVKLKQVALCFVVGVNFVSLGLIEDYIGWEGCASHPKG